VLHTLASTSGTRFTPGRRLRRYAEGPPCHFRGTPEGEAFSKAVRHLRLDACARAVLRPRAICLGLHLVKGVARFLKDGLGLCNPLLSEELDGMATSEAGT